MNIYLLKNSIIDKLSVINRLVPKKADLNVLNFFKIETNENKIYLYSTDLELTYKSSIPAKVIESGEFLIPAKQFSEIINNFYEEEIQIESKGDNLLIKGENTFCSLVGILKEEYPLVPEFNKDNYLEIDTILFENFINKLIINTKTANIIKPELAGIYLYLDNNYLYLVSTDSIRLSEVKLKKDIILTNINNEIKILIPSRILEEYLKIRKKPIKTKIYIEEHQLTIDLEDQLLISKLLTLNYPDYKQVIPKDFNLEIQIDKNEVLKILKLNNVFVNKNKEIKLSFDLDKQEIEFYTFNEFFGENKNKLKFEIIKNELDDNFELSFNLEFLLDGVRVIDSDKIFVGINIPTDINITPILIKSVLEDDFIYILVPL
jgi:DNA polymerase-3 subunit beta